MSSYNRDNLRTFFYSLSFWLADLIYRSAYYIISMICILMIPIYVGRRESIWIKSYHYFLILAKFGFGSKINPSQIFDHYFPTVFLQSLVPLVFAIFTLSLFYLIRSLPPIRLYVAQIGRDLYSEKRLGYGKDDTGRFNENMKGRRVGFIRQFIYTLFKIGADLRSPSHIPQEPLLGSPYPKSGFYHDYDMRNRNLIGNKLGETYYVSTLEARYVIVASCLCGLIVLIGLRVHFFNDPRYMDDIFNICLMIFASIVITHILSFRDVDENMLINHFGPKQEEMTLSTTTSTSTETAETSEVEEETSEVEEETSEVAEVDLGTYFKNKRKRGE